MNGQTWWLSCFANRTICYYTIDPSRGSHALEKYFIEAFDGAGLGVRSSIFRRSTIFRLTAGS
jgi:hypothetical protein